MKPGNSTHERGRITGQDSLHHFAGGVCVAGTHTAHGNSSATAGTSEAPHRNTVTLRPREKKSYSARWLKLRSKERTLGKAKKLCQNYRRTLPLAKKLP